LEKEVELRVTGGKHRVLVVEEIRTGREEEN